MITRLHSAKAAAFALATALALAACALAPGMAWASVSAVSTAATNPTYENPATGVIEDSGGASNAALGESMVKGATYESALVEQDAEGFTFVTLRFKLMDQISAMNFQVSADGSSYEAVESAQMQTNAEDNTADYRFQVPSENATIKCVMDVIPMGRSVTFFVALSDMQEGNLDTFVQTVAAGEGSDDAAVAAVAAAASANGDGQNGANDADDSSASDAALVGETSGAGVQEFDAEGREVTGEAQTAPLDGGTVALIFGTVAAVAIIAGAGIYVAYVRPKRARQAAAAAAACAPDAQSTGDGQPDASRA